LAALEAAALDSVVVTAAGLAAIAVAAATEILIIAMEMLHTDSQNFPQVKFLSKLFSFSENHEVFQRSPVAGRCDGFKTVITIARK
jgi:hypothetical protein